MLTAPPQEPRGWSFPAILEAVGALLPSWLRKLGVQEGDLADATQDALIAFWQDRAGIPENPREARVELLRRVARVALRVRRHARRRGERFVLADDIDALDPRDVEAWVEARVLVLEALERIDEDTRVVLIAHDLEGRSNAEIGEALGEKEDTIKHRVNRGRERLQDEIERLLGGKQKKKGKKRAHAAILPLGLLGADPFDRALFGALLEAEGKIPPLCPPPPPVSAVVPIIAAAAPAIVGPLLGGLAALVLGLFFLVGPRWLPTPRPELPPDMGYAMRSAPRVELVSTAAVSASSSSITSPAAPVAPLPAAPLATTTHATAPRHRASSSPVDLPKVTPEKLAESIARAREVQVGKGPQ